MQYGLSEKTHLYRHFCHDELQISSPLFFASKIHLVTPYPAISTVKKFIKMKLFTQRCILFLLGMTQILHIPKVAFAVRHN